MARPRKNQLAIRSIGGGLFQLYGYMHGKRVRIRSDDAGELEQKMASLEQSLIAPPERTQSLRMTTMSEAQLRDAEAAVRRAGGRSLLECVEASDRVMVSGEPVALSAAWREWESYQKERKRYDRTIDNNRNRVEAFVRYLADHGAVNVGDVTPEHFERFVFRGDRADFTRANDAAVLRAWARFWKRKRWVKELPFEIDFKDLRSRARAVELPRILSPKQARGLLASAEAHADGALAAYTALACWCFLRHAEVLRVTADDLRLDAKQPVVEVRPRKRGTVSYRTVNVPACVLPILKAAKARAIKAGAAYVAEWGQVRWNTVRANAGLAELGRVKNKKRTVTSEIWQENILRHTGISYFYQRTGDVKETCRQAGNSSSTAFAHYLNLPAEGAAEEFYAKGL